MHSTKTMSKATDRTCCKAKVKDMTAKTKDTFSWRQGVSGQGHGLEDYKSFLL